MIVLYSPLSPLDLISLFPVIFFFHVVILSILIDIHYMFCPLFSPELIVGASRRSNLSVQ